jgi:hypothetical protein
VPSPKNQPSGVTFILEDDQDPPEKETLVFEEQPTLRKTEDVRVENPDDPEQYVIVQRITSWTVQGPDGICRQFNMHPPEEA